MIVFDAVPPPVTVFCSVCNRRTCFHLSEIVMTFARQRAFIKEEITSRPSPTLTETPLTGHSSCSAQRVVLRNDQSGINNDGIKKYLYGDKTHELGYISPPFVFYGLDFVCSHIEFTRLIWYSLKKKIYTEISFTDILLVIWVMMSGHDHFYISVYVFTEKKKIKIMWHFLCFCTNFLAASYMLNTKWDYRCSFILSVIIGALAPSLSFRQLISRGLQTYRVALHVL